MRLLAGLWACLSGFGPVGFGLAGLGLPTAQAEGLAEARYLDPTTRYDHAVLGDAVEWGALALTGAESGQVVTLTLPPSRVFEDVAPRLVDVDLDGAFEALVVESDQSLGARLAIYSADGSLMAATPFIGQRYRWLAPVGAADLDGDGRVEVAYVDRPHLARTLRVWRYDDGALVEVANLPGVTNHRIGEADIAGGLRECLGTTEMIVASADWARVLGVSFDGATLTARDLGPHVDRSSLANAMTC
jgi:hypothetical protein